MSWIENRFEPGLIVTSLDWAINWGRISSIWPMTFGLACCAIEMMATGASRFDIDRFGAGAFRGSPRQSDLMIVAGTVTYKMAERVRRLFNQMPEPKFVLAMGACTIGGGPYFKHGYHVVKGVDLVIPVDIYVPGCPPRPESLLEGLMRLQDLIKHQSIGKDQFAKAKDAMKAAARARARAFCEISARPGRVLSQYPVTGDTHDDDQRDLLPEQRRSRPAIPRASRRGPACRADRS